MAEGIVAAASGERMQGTVAPGEDIGDECARLRAIADRAFAYATEMDFTFLYDDRRKLFSIGYESTASTYDNSFYDLLASEARLAWFVAIAKGDVPVEHWFHLGRSLTSDRGVRALVSWSGSMFEYLMPLLVTQSYPFTLLDQTYHGAVRRQIMYGQERSVPWGMSESAYNVRDRGQTYQYRAFGVPDLALKRGLSKDLVVAPYATMLAMLRRCRAQALRNLTTLENEGALGPYGFRDAVDYTRPAPDSTRAVVRHVHGAPHRHEPRRAHQRSAASGLAAPVSCRSARAVERARAAGAHPASPRDSAHGQRRRADSYGADRDRQARGSRDRHAVHAASRASRCSATSRTPLSSRTRAADTAATATSSSRAGAAIPRATIRASGSTCKDLTNGRVWSAAHQPVGVDADHYRVLFATDRVEFQRTRRRHRHGNGSRRVVRRRRRGAARHDHQPIVRSRTRSS